MLHHKTSHEAWTILKTIYANPSRGHILQIKDNLANLTKNQLSISDYMNAVKSYTDKLAILGKPMDFEDIIYTILKGLDYETFKPVICCEFGGTPVAI